MSSVRTSNLRQTCSRSRKHRRLRITPPSQQTSMADSAARFPEQDRSAVGGGPQRGPLRRPYQSLPAKARVLDDESPFNRDECALHHIEINFFEPVPQTALEPNFTLPVQDPPITASSNHHNRLSLAQRYLVATFITNGSIGPDSYSTDRHPVHNSFHSLAISPEVLQNLRLKSLMSSVGSIPGLSDVSSSINGSTSQKLNHQSHLPTWATLLSRMALKTPT